MYKWASVPSYLCFIRLTCCLQGASAIWDLNLHMKKWRDESRKYEREHRVWDSIRNALRIERSSSRKWRTGPLTPSHLTDHLLPISSARQSKELSVVFSAARPCFPLPGWQCCSRTEWYGWSLVATEHVLYWRELMECNYCKWANLLHSCMRPHNPQWKSGCLSSAAPTPSERSGAAVTAARWRWFRGLISKPRSRRESKVAASPTQWLRAECSKGTPSIWRGSCGYFYLRAVTRRAVPDSWPLTLQYIICAVLTTAIYSYLSIWPSHRIVLAMTMHFSAVSGRPGGTHRKESLQFVHCEQWRLMRPYYISPFSLLRGSFTKNKLRRHIIFCNQQIEMIIINVSYIPQSRSTPPPIPPNKVKVEKLYFRNLWSLD